jgi:hypothetical protein
MLKFQHHADRACLGRHEQTGFVSEDLHGLTETVLPEKYRIETEKELKK